MESIIRDMLKYAEGINPQSTDTDLRRVQLDMVAFIGQILSELTMGNTSPKSWANLGAKLATEWNEGTLDINMDYMMLDNLNLYAHGADECFGVAAFGKLVEWHDDAESGTWVSTHPLTDSEIETAWREFEDVPFDETNDCDLVLLEEWRGFPKGVSREVIRGFFDKKYSKGLYTLVDLNFVCDDEGSDLCECEYCKVKIPWGGADSSKGGIWSCEKCGHYFCEDCFKAKFGAEVAHKMFSMDGDIDDVLCHVCYTGHI